RIVAVANIRNAQGNLSAYSSFATGTRTVTCRSSTTPTRAWAGQRRSRSRTSTRSDRPDRDLLEQPAQDGRRIAARSVGALLPAERRPAGRLQRRRDRDLLGRQDRRRRQRAEPGATESRRLAPDLRRLQPVDTDRDLGASSSSGSPT